MKSFFVFSSPHLYYMENLSPISYYLEKNGHNVYQSFYSTRSTSPEHQEYVVRGGSNNLLKKFFEEKIKVDAVILTQCWWLYERKIVSECAKRNIPYFIVEHAPQMLLYDKKRARYRSSIRGAKAHYMWGTLSKKIMIKSGCSDNLPIGGSPRLDLINNIGNSNYIKKKYGKKIISLYTTSNVMSPDYLPLQLENIQKWAGLNDYSVVIKKHPRFSINKALSSSIDKNIVKVFEETDFESNIHLINASNIVAFSFPGSMMIPAAVLGKKIVSLYGKSSNPEVKKYANSYQASIFNYIDQDFRKVEDWSPDLNALKKYSKLNLFRPKEGSAAYISKKILAEL